MTQSDDAPQPPSAIYVWLVPSEQMLEQPGSWRIRKWDTEPFPEANFTLRSETAPRLPQEPTHAMLKALAGDPVILAGSDEAELRLRYAAMLAATPACASPNRDALSKECAEEAEWVRSVAATFKMPRLSRVATLLELCDESPKGSDHG